MKKILRKSVVIIIPLAIIFYIFSQCVHVKQNYDKNENRDYIVYNIEMKPQYLSYLEKDSKSEELFMALFEGLVNSDSDGNIIPAIAESWTLNKDETCYTFKIRENASYSDGRKITADDFVKFFTDILSYKYKSKNTEQLYCIIGAEEYSKKQNNLSKLEIKALDIDTLQIKLREPSNYFLNILAQPEFTLRDINVNTENWKENFRSIKYTGPYVINNILENDEVVLEKNNNYWNDNGVMNDKFHITFIENNEEVLANFENGKIDIFKNPPLSEFNRLHDSNKLMMFNSNSIFSLIFNLNGNKIIHDSNLRKAIAISINRQDISDEIFNNTAVPALSYIPKEINDGIKGKYINKNYFSCKGNVERAKIFLKESDYLKSKDSIKLVYLNSNDNKKLCDKIAKTLKEELKLNVLVQGFNEEQLANVITKNEYDIIMKNNNPCYDYPTALLQEFSSNNINNIYGYKNTKYDEMLLKIKNEKNLWNKKEYIKNCEDMLIDDAIIIPVLFQNIVICKKEKIDGIYCMKMGNIRLDKIYKVN